MLVGSARRDSLSNAAEGLFDDLSALWAEAILTADLTPAERQTWAERLADWHNEAAEYGSPPLRLTPWERQTRGTTA
jgi:hypothetical protein